jgi:hypothetical protein
MEAAWLRGEHPGAFHLDGVMRGRSWRASLAKSARQRFHLEASANAVGRREISERCNTQFPAQRRSGGARRPLASGGADRYIWAHGGHHFGCRRRRAAGAILPLEGSQSRTMRRQVTPAQSIYRNCAAVTLFLLSTL